MSGITTTIRNPPIFRATATILLANVRLPQLPRSGGRLRRPEEGGVGADCGGIAAAISTNTFRIERAKPAIPPPWQGFAGSILQRRLVRRQLARLRRSDENMSMVLAAEPPKP
jgi:hypothetical protein